MEYLKESEFSALSSAEKQDYYDNLVNAMNSPMFSSRMVELAEAFEAIPNFMSSLSHAKTLRNSAEEQLKTELVARKSRRNTIIVAACILLALSLIMLSISLIPDLFDSKRADYERAVALYEEGKMIEALEIFKTLGKYRDTMVYMVALYDYQNAAKFGDQYLVLWQSITLGAYDQDDDLTNGGEPLEWIVLEIDKENNCALLISKYVLAYDVLGSDNSKWTSTDMKNWLDSDFYNAAFSAAEKDRVIPSEFCDFNSNNEAIADTIYYGYVSLLSSHEFSKITDADTKLGTYTKTASSLLPSNTKGVWWLRTATDNGFAFVGSNKIIDTDGKAANEAAGIRPIIRVRLGE